MIFTLCGSRTGGPDELVRVVMESPPGSAWGYLARTWPSAVSGVGACRSIADGLGLGADDYLSTERLAVLPGARSIQALSGLVRGPSFRGLLIEDSVERELVEAALPAIRA